MQYSFAIVFSALFASIRASNYTYLGCYNDTTVRALPYGPHEYGYYPDTCASECSEYTYFALQNDGWCCCGNDFDYSTQYGPAYVCQSDQKGGIWANDLFRNDNAVNYTYIGCYNDTATRALPYGPQAFGYSPDTCSAACLEYRYFALQAGGWCGCANNFVYATQYGVQSTCPSDQRGAAWANDLFENEYNQLDYTYLGCYIDTVIRALPSGPLQFGYYPDTCASACSEYTYFALQADGWCGCGNDFDYATQYGAGDGCPSSQRGSDWLNDLFRIDNGLDYTYIGCYNDTETHALPDGPQASGYSPDTCSSVCLEYRYFALQNGGWCGCGNDFVYATQYGELDSCPLDQTGAMNANDLFEHEGNQIDYIYIGCYTDTVVRALPYGPLAFGYYPDTCASACSEYRYFALQAGGWCGCADDFDYATQYGATDSCPSDQRGAAWANDVFEIDRWIGDNIGALIVNSNQIEVSSSSINTADLYCGNDNDKPLWAAVLSLDDDILTAMNAVRSEDVISTIFDYILCSEAIYHAMTTAVTAPKNAIRTVNDILELLSTIPTVGDYVEDSVDALNDIIINIFDEITPNDIDIDWNEIQQENTDDGEIFNPFQELAKVAQLLSTTICQEIYDDIDSMTQDLKTSTAIIELKDTFDSKISSFLDDSSNGLFSDDLKQELKTNDMYKSFAFGTSIGMKLCFSKGMNGCVTRSIGISMNLKDEMHIFESRSMQLEYPSLNYGIASSGFVHFTLLSDYNNMWSDELSAFIGVQAQIPGSETLSTFMDYWQEYSGLAENIPFVGTSADIGVDFVNGHLNDSALIMSLLTEGGSGSIAMIYGVSPKIHCSGLRVYLDIGDVDAFGASLFFGYEYRQNDTNSIKQGLDWIEDIDTLSSIDILQSSVLSLTTEIGEKLNDYLEDIASELLQSLITAILDIVNGPIKLGNAAINTLNDAIDTFNADVIGSANTAIYGVNTGISQLNSAKTGMDYEWGLLQSRLSSARSKCKVDFSSYCYNFDVKIYDIDVCVNDIMDELGLDLNSVCDAIFDAVPLNYVTGWINQIPSIPTLSYVPTFDERVPGIPIVNVGDISDQSDQMHVETMPIIHVNRNTKNTISPMVLMLIIATHCICVAAGYGLRGYVVYRRKKGAFELVKT